MSFQTIKQLGHALGSLQAARRAEAENAGNWTEESRIALSEKQKLSPNPQRAYDHAQSMFRSFETIGEGGILAVPVGLFKATEAVGHLFAAASYALVSMVAD